MSASVRHQVRLTLVPLCIHNFNKYSTRIFVSYRNIIGRGDKYRVRDMDPSSVLEQTTQDVSNLPAEFHHLLEEIKSVDMELYDVRKKCTIKDLQIQKYIKQHGSMSDNPKEAEFSGKIKEELTQCKKLQNKKCALANTALFLVTKHLAKLEKSIVILEEDGLLAPLEEEENSSGEYSRENSVMSANERRKRKTTSSGSGTNGVNIKKRKQLRASPNRVQYQDREASQSSKTGGHPARQAGQQQRAASKETADDSSLPLVNRDANFDLHDANDDLFSSINTNEEEDKTLYCFCQSVSYGEMVACDGENCKFEWFHYSCVNLKEPPKGAWYCPDCRQQLNR